ncbi:unnamed protein product, partial [Mesorhabditis belari]|uniref:Uncharacterized protein n=1 Tax=Mesorhabditis belari TaxID=2138241 RepID=A0AAF3FQF7_9BILA
MLKTRYFVSDDAIAFSPSSQPPPYEKPFDPAPKRKLAFVVCLIVVVAVFLTIIVFLTYQLLSTKSSMKEEIGSTTLETTKIISTFPAVDTTKPGATASTTTTLDWMHWDHTIQSVSAEGQLLCGGKPSAGTTVKLFEHDTLTPDDQLDQSSTNQTGHFRLKGISQEGGGERMQAKIYIYHRCMMEITLCLYKSKIYIPDQFVTVQGEPPKLYQTGTVDLATMERSWTCIH